MTPPLNPFNFQTPPLSFLLQKSLYNVDSFQLWEGEGVGGFVICKYKSNLLSDCTVTVLNIRAVQAATMWCTSSHIPQLTFTRILLDDVFVGRLFFFFNLLVCTLYIILPVTSINVRTAFMQHQLTETLQSWCNLRILSYPQPLCVTQQALV